ncbi:hypothetical protein [Virgisporangium aurantiacum]|uniref:Secreted protein n=1 Tax=Virgisporangium aurantiacum TaxID=175570 RepID=A0A8J3YY30_9ACTN|nr:hypothetical protein [Virgisporangium aurantiacum]GIJ54124.1 hypothetical protein Vau01_016400 [Virgisporangium aurantiacum]
MRLLKRLIVGSTVAVTMTLSPVGPASAANAEPFRLPAGSSIESVQVKAGPFTDGPFDNYWECYYERQVNINNGWQASPCDWNPIKMAWYFVYWS